MKAARAYIAPALDAFERMDAAHGTATSLLVVAGIAIVEGDADDGAQLLAAGPAMFARERMCTPPTLQGASLKGATLTTGDVLALALLSA